MDVQFVSSLFCTCVFYLYVTGQFQYVKDADCRTVNEGSRPYKTLLQQNKNAVQLVHYKAYLNQENTKVKYKYKHLYTVNKVFCDLSIAAISLFTSDWLILNFEYDFHC